MSTGSLFGRRIHIAGSIDDSPSIAPAAEVKRAREFIEVLVPRLVERGATFVLPIDDEKTRQTDGLPICFDWLVLRILRECIGNRPINAPEPYVFAVQHHKTEGQVPTEFASLWQDFRDSAHVDIRNVGHWDMYSKRMEEQAGLGDILIALGGKDGVLNLANLYHDAGKPVIPLNLPITKEGTGALRLFGIGLSFFDSGNLFRTKGRRTAREWMARVDFRSRGRTSQGQVAIVLDLLDRLDAPRAFVVRLMNEKHDLHSAVDEFFSRVVAPVVEEEYGYELAVVDGSQPYESGTIPQDIFEKLHRSRVAVADLTGMRPNCLIELGYALGRGLPTMMLAREGEQLPFDVQGIPIHYWNSNDPIGERQVQFRQYWMENIRRPHLVDTGALVQ